jgi:hypothetical protein
MFSIHIVCEVHTYADVLSVVSEKFKGKRHYAHYGLWK